MPLASLSVFGAVSLLSHALGLPGAWAKSSPHTHSARRLEGGAILKAFQPPSHFQARGIRKLISYKSHTEYVDLHRRSASKCYALAARAPIIATLVGEDIQFSLQSTSEGDITSHIYFTQTIGRFEPDESATAQNDLPIINAVANVALDRTSSVVSWGHSFVNATQYTMATKTPPSPKLSADNAALAAAAFFGGKAKVRHGASNNLAHYALDTGEIILTKAVRLELQRNRIVEVYVDADSGEVHGSIDFSADLTMNVVPIWQQSPVNGGFSVRTNPEDNLASPSGWETINGTKENATRGNNAFAFKGSTTASTAESSNDTYDYPWDSSAAPEAENNINVAVSNAWYVVNTVHDIQYRYGFTETAFNFQVNNFGKGGLGNDSVGISVQDSLDENNAVFVTLPDGELSLMRLYLFNSTVPNRDSALQNDIVAHEITHGLTNRMTGGGTAKCLQTTEALGLGEGWSDAFADWVQQTGKPVKDWTTGGYVLNNTAGVRSHPYSVNRTVNPLTYASLSKLNQTLRQRFQSHDMGEIWANILHVIHSDLVEFAGFAEDACTNPDGVAGNQIWLQ
ncbi:Fungalysin metallopeptidase-domain-containing protein [Auriculariales sp. MPI-PUGE-AT-0066]|nr:Fungalysin metallopeptidase-domain-containing protein [Auriculariales sp. MPI-PUGE-AT-0066]